MSNTGCCGTGSAAGTNGDYEVVRLEKAKNSCNLCEDYAERQKSKPVVVMCCEGACLRGEVARQAVAPSPRRIRPHHSDHRVLGHNKLFDSNRLSGYKLNMKAEARLFKFLADESRLKIFWLLMQHDELCV